MSPITIDEYRMEVQRQRSTYRRLYILRRVVGWPKLALVLGKPKAGWYLARGDTRFGTCATIGPCNSHAQAHEVARGWFPEQYLVFADVVLLWDEPPENHDRGHRRFARPWYRVPARAR